MRRFDKKINIAKANLLTEQRYLNESINQRDIQILIDAQNSLRDIQEDSIFSGKLSDQENWTLMMARQVCKKLENKLVGP